jgi:hypothetical protein
MKFLKVPKVERFLAWSGKEFQSLAASYCMIIMLQLCFICACFYDLLFMSYAACAISKYALCIVDHALK